MYAPAYLLLKQTIADGLTKAGLAAPVNYDYGQWNTDSGRADKANTAAKAIYIGFEPIRVERHGDGKGGIGKPMHLQEIEFRVVVLQQTRLDSDARITDESLGHMELVERVMAFLHQKAFRRSDVPGTTIEPASTYNAVQLGDLRLVGVEPETSLGPQIVTTLRYRAMYHHYPIAIDFIKTANIPTFTVEVTLDSQTVS